ncbi:tryptophan 2,3-dioxygenase family protein [Kitasatospora camelliae]|uniref:Tryptophan 2,3-dioxygenase family protein n=1 Tax=Kitasatospora camelliae TaxID=3156397 RepID=A0AAU8JRR1_9ACTN
MSDVVYGEYLGLAALLDGPADREVHDEQLFVTVHRVHELWFDLLLHDLTDARDRMLAGETRVPLRRLARCAGVQRALLDTVGLLDTLPPQEFLAFRGSLGTASGAQSAQFHELEVLAGRSDPRLPDRLTWLTPAERTRLERRLAEPSLWDGFLAVLAKAGLDVSDPPAREAAYARLLRDPELEPAADLADALHGYDQSWAAWRYRHSLVAERQIGTRPGTGGSTGVQYLRQRADHRFFPELTHR